MRRTASSMAKSGSPPWPLTSASSSATMMTARLTASPDQPRAICIVFLATYGFMPMVRATWSGLPRVW